MVTNKKIANKRIETKFNKLFKIKKYHNKKKMDKI